MKKFKLFSLMAMFVLGSMFFVSCEDDVVDPVSDLPTPEAPANLRANSSSATSVMLMWDKSTSEDSTWFSGYEISVTGGTPMAAKTVGKVHSYDFTGLEAGQIYTFTVKAVNKDSKVSTGSTSVSWSPAMRFETADIKMYSASSNTYGSGLSLYDATNKKPMIWKVADKAKWHLGFNDGNNKLMFGPAAAIGLGTIDPTATVEISDEYWEADDFGTIYMPNTAAPTKIDLSKLSFSAIAWDIKELNSAKSLVFVVRVKEAGATTWNYAKVLVVKSATGFLQGTAPDQYIQVKISYQAVANVPYAKQ